MASSLFRPLDDFYHPPSNRLGERTRLHDAHGIPHLGPLFIAGLHRLGSGELLAVGRVREPPHHRYRYGLGHLVAGHDSGAGLPPAAGRGVSRLGHVALVSVRRASSPARGSAATSLVARCPASGSGTASGCPPTPWPTGTPAGTPPSR